MKENFISYSISVAEYDRNKNEKDTFKLKWKEREGTTETLINDIKNNRAFCACFYHNGDTFTNRDKSDNNLKSTHFIIFDMDAVKLTASDFYTQMLATEIPPSLVYTTANNGKFKRGKNESYNNRYRVVYVLDAPIYNADLYKEIHQTLKNEIFSTIDDRNVYNDNSDSSVSHFYAGCKNGELYSCDTVISLAWVCDRYDIKTANEPNKLIESGRDRYIISRVADNNKHGNYIQYLINQRINKLNEGGRDRQIIKKEREHYMSMATTLSHSAFINDYYNLSVKEIREKYISVYPSYEFTQVEFDETQPYYMVPSDYIEIKRKWHYEEVEKTNGDTYKITKIEKCKDGQGRRRRLFINLILRRLIYPQITFEHLLFNAVYELKNYIDNVNTDDKITKYELAEIAINAYFEDIEKWSKLKNYHKPKYKINKEWCNAHGVKPRQQAIKVRGEFNRQAKEKKWSEIDNYYNPTLTNNGNIELLKSYGIEIGLTALKDYKKSRGYNKPKNGKANKAIERENNTEMAQHPTATANGSQRDTQSKKNNHMEQQHTATANGSQRATESANNEVTSGDVLTMEIVKAVVNELDAYYSDGTVIKEVEPNRYEVNLSNAILYPELADKVYNYLYGHGLNAGKLYIDRDDDDKCCKKFSMWLG